MMQNKNPDDWVLATGETHTVKEFAKKAFDHVGLNYEDYVKVSEKYFRQNEVEYLLGDYSKAKKELGWEPKTSFDDLVSMIVDHDIDEAKEKKYLLKIIYLNLLGNFQPKLYFLRTNHMFFLNLVQGNLMFPTI